jgi:hypothetical protein
MYPHRDQNNNNTTTTNNNNNNKRDHRDNNNNKNNNNRDHRDNNNNNNNNNSNNNNSNRDHRDKKYDNSNRAADDGVAAPSETNVVAGATLTDDMDIATSLAGRRQLLRKPRPVQSDATNEHIPCGASNGEPCVGSKAYSADDGQSPADDDEAAGNHHDVGVTGRISEDRFGDSERNEENIDSMDEVPSRRRRHLLHIVAVERACMRALSRLGVVRQFPEDDDEKADHDILLNANNDKVTKKTRAINNDGDDRIAATRIKPKGTIDPAIDSMAQRGKSSGIP